ncbi:MAG TPA: sigma-70 family RNA polymerase sigma factor [Polyangiaceae bacterium]|nr:sigma-70 family RNA polymerase sigma factor [Polyangiaceae bacterium]
MSLPSTSNPPPAGSAPVARFPLERLTDAHLVAGAAGGDRDALAAIWDRYSGLVRGVLYGALGPDSAIEDLVQEVFLGLMKSAQRISDGNALRGYLASMAVRQGALEIRRRRVRRWVGLSPTGDVPEVAVAAHDWEHHSALQSLHRVLGQLSERRRMAFVLRHVEGLEMLEVARALDVSESTLRRELQVARTFIEKSSRREPALAEYLSRQGQAAQEDPNHE